MIEAFREGMRCVHVTKSPFQIGQNVTVKVDWDRRFDHMQQHSGQHLLSAIADKSEFGWETVGWY